MRETITNIKALALALGFILLFGGSFGMMYAGDAIDGMVKFLEIFGAFYIFQNTKELLLKKEADEQRKLEEARLTREVMKKYFD